MTEYTSGRESPAPERPLDESERDLAALAAAFGEAWLARGGDHPLQRLWGRKDGLATTQLLLLGAAVAELQSPFGAWTKDQVRAVKAGGAERRGAVFEFVLLEALRAGGAQAAPARRNAPGHGLTIGSGGGALDLSLRSFGASDYEASARREWSRVLAAYVAARQDLLLRPAAGVIVFASRYPDAKDWALLLEAAPRLARTNWEGPFAQAQLGDCWRVMLHPLPSAMGPYAATPASYQLVTVIPHHADERADWLGHLDAAAHEARKLPRAGDDRAHALVVRVREGAALSHYAAWTQEHLARTGEGAADAVFLYQPSLAFTEDERQTIHHAFVAARADGFAAWQARGSDRALAPTFGLGETGGPPDRHLQINGQLVDPGPSYIFQRGEYFTGGGESGTARVLAPGIHQHAIVAISGRPFILKGKFPADDALDLFD